MNCKTVRRSLYAVIFIAASLPAVCGYGREGGDILLWLARVEELGQGLKYGSLMIYPSAELVSTYGGQLTAHDTNLWLLAPALIRLAGGSLAASYRIFMTLIQAATLFTTIMMFGRIFKERETVLIGVLLYMTCPYRLYICYDRADLAQAVVWMLVPLLVWAVLGEKWIVSSLALAGIGYASGFLVLVLAGLVILAALLGKKPRLLVPAALGTLLYLPGGIRLLLNLLQGVTVIENMPLAPVGGRGYYFGQFFSSFAYKEGMPGLGLGLVTALLVLVWFLFCNGRADMPGSCRAAAVLGLILLFCSSHWFPWDLIQRLGGVFYRLVPLSGSPAVFFGLSCMALCIPGAYAVENSIFRLGCRIKK